MVEYELFAADDSPLAVSVAHLTYWWFSKLENSARKAGLEPEETLTSFNAEPGREHIYVLSKKDTD